MVFCKACRDSYVEDADEDANTKLIPGKRGILFMNVGTPDEPTSQACKKYLEEFLLDPEVIDIPYPIRQLVVRGLILNTRPQKIAPKYKGVWMDEGSPLRVYTQRIADSVESLIPGVICRVGMRYGNPSTESSLKSLRDAGVDELMIAPLFPHYAQATTETSFKFAYKWLKKINWQPNIYHLTPFPNDQRYITSLSESIKRKLTPDSHLLFSYHGLPMSHIRRAERLGIPKYNEHCESTTNAVVKYLGLNESQWTMSYQSRLGPVKWLTPATDKTIKKLVKKVGIKKLVIVSPAFLADGLETLEELDQENREIFEENGGEELTVLKCLNADQDWMKEFSQIILENFESKPTKEDRLACLL